IATNFALLAYLPGRWLIRPFQSAFGKVFRQAAALLLGWAFYTFFADQTLKWLGPTAAGFFLVPGALTWACAAAVRFSVRPGTNDDVAAWEATPRQSLFACLLGAVALFQVLPVQWGDGLYWGPPEIDWRSRLPVTNAIARDGLPAANPFFNPDGD